MHIIAGQFKGKKLKTVEGLTSRPTLSRIRESIFNILMPYFPGAAFLDLYAGAGSIGLEAASRGADRVVLVEKDRSIFKVLEKNADLFRERHSGVQVRCADALAEARRLIELRETYDLVFLDPPYAPEALAPWATGIRLDLLLKPGGRVILQHAKQAAIPPDWGHCRLHETRVYGKTGLSFFHAPEG